MRIARRTSGRGTEGPGYALTSDENDADFWGFARAAEGLFTPLPEEEEEGTRRVRLVGCAPQGGLGESLEHVGSRRAVTGNAWFELLDADGAAMGSYFVNDVTVVDVQPSTLDAGLRDLTLTLWCDQALPGADSVWKLLHGGRLNRTGMWRDLSAADRRAWLSVALRSRTYQRRGRADAPAGQVFALDGRGIVDLDSFYCAIGEAINGPGGYFGWNLDALDDCLRGGWGASPPFALQWERSAAARARLTDSRSTSADEPAVFDLLLEIFEERGVRVVLR
ncbi:barstar family protein [Streptomyces sp. NPDC046876]|uniref:barstar family protein n=1 Tax=Streptomyces sp. NPDC046876 TaxID=3155616 RepID=UPI0033F337A9